MEGATLTVDEAAVRLSGRLSTGPVAVGAGDTGSGQPACPDGGEVDFQDPTMSPVPATAVPLFPGETRWPDCRNRLPG